MAFLDNPTIILAHIRQSHVTSDDTGMCEMVLIDHDVDIDKFNPSAAFGERGAEPQGSNGDTQGYVYSQSVDITSSWDFGIRRRSNTGACCCLHSQLPQDRAEPARWLPNLLRDPLVADIMIPLLRCAVSRALIAVLPIPVQRNMEVVASIYIKKIQIVKTSNLNPKYVNSL